MDKLWSPWRSQYIESFNKKKSDSKGCVFCGTQNEDIHDDNSLLVSKGEKTFTMLNLYPYNTGHLMVVPYRHLSDFGDLTTEELTEVMLKTKELVAALKEISNPGGFNIGANLGKTAGAGIANHIHFHIVPRWNGDTNFMPVIGEVKVLSQDLLKTKSELQQVLGII
ncbi:MAG: HIT domain-containing protein [Ignavibacteriaceae bacterium]|nr:MAG: HIT domain-containing protein [Ignavibacteriaceae bacterium]MBW7871856.1 HIT domain-containing protein [Ignavibacteria bacterium]MBZ0197299.1 HIT domain-containing protein [Ignavibacteriaceae bacterium]OQY76905.1 MAG: HIT family hydrolase [Ignavibacteriales bacterium UTCHB3]